MSIFIVYVQRQDDWAEISRFEASGTADALKKAKIVIPPSYGNGPIKIVEQPDIEQRSLCPHPNRRS